MKKLVLLFILFAFNSCEIQYDGETKLQVSGKLVDKSGNQLSGKKIDILVRQTGSSFTSAYIEDLITFGISDNNGLFTFLIPSPVQDNEIIIKLNESNFLEKTISFNKSNFKNYKLDFQNLLLTNKNEVTNLKIILKKESTNKSITDIKIEAIQYQENTNLNNNVVDENNEFFLKYTIFKNQTVILKYKIEENLVITNFSEEIIIGENQVIKTITY